MAVGSCALMMACVHAAGQAAKEAAVQATPPAVSEFLRAANEPENQRLFGHLLQLPEVQDAARLVGAGLVEGVVAGAPDGDREATIRRVTDQFVGSLMQAVRQHIGEVSPQFGALAAGAVDSMIREGLAPRNAEQIDGFVNALTHTLASSLAQGIRGELGPAIRDALTHDVGPGLNEMLKSGGLDNSLERASRDVARGAVLGLDDALTQLDTKQKNGQKNSLLGRLSGAANTGIQFTTIVAATLGLAVLGLVLWIVKLMAQTRRDQAEASRREAAMTMIAEALRATEGKAWSPELQEVLRAQMRDPETAGYFQDLLRKQQRPPSTPIHH
jgi:hypothetical protein